MTLTSAGPKIGAADKVRMQCVRPDNVTQAARGQEPTEEASHTIHTERPCLEDQNRATAGRP